MRPAELVRAVSQRRPRRPNKLIRRARTAAAALDPPLRCADIGARWGPEDRWRFLSPPVEIVAFEPDEAECRRLREQEKGNVRYEATALGATPGPATLYLTQDPACSSLYPPDPALVAAYPELAVIAPVGERVIELETLDGWCERAGVELDVLKIDVQGAELDVLRGASAQLRSIVAIELEVEFTPIYQGQPLFGDVDAFLRAHGFALYRLAHLVHYARHGSVLTHNAARQASDKSLSGYDQGGQLFWAHAFYLPVDVLEGAGGERRQRAAIAAAAFGLSALSRTLFGDRG